MFHSKCSNVRKRFCASLVILTMLCSNPADMALASSTAKKTVVQGVGVSKVYKVSDPIQSVRSSNPKIATITKKSKKSYVVQGVKAGKTALTVKYGQKTLKVTVKVGATSLKPKSEADDIVVLTEGISKSVSVKVANAKNENIQWSSSDTDVVSLTKTSTKVNKAKTATITNTITAKEKGTAKITVRSRNTGKKCTLSVVVNEKAQPTNIPVATGMTTPIANTTPVGHTAQPGSAAPTVLPTQPAVVSGTPVQTHVSTQVPKDTPVVSATEAVANTDVAASPQPTDIQPGSTTLVPGSTVAPVEDYTKPAAVEQAFIYAANKVQIDFTKQLKEVDVNNFTIGGVTILSAELSEDHKSVLLKTSSLSTYRDYYISFTGLVSQNGLEVKDQTTTLSYSELAYRIILEAEDDISVVKAVSGEAISLTASVCTENNQLIKENVDILFKTTAGSLSNKVTSTSNGKVSTTFYAEPREQREEVKITAIIYASDNKGMIYAQDIYSVVMDPYVGTEREQLDLPYITKVRVDSCDRVMLYFNKYVSATAYTKNTERNRYGYDATKLALRILSTKDANKTSITSSDVYMTPVALGAVPDNPKALYAYLDTDSGSYLVDNSYALVEITDRLQAPESCYTRTCLVNDMSAPTVTKIYNEGMTKIKVVFSEPVQSGASNNGAGLLSNWVLDGSPLSSGNYGVSLNKATATVGTFDLVTGKDERHVVTLQAGKDSNLNQEYFSTGSHSLEILNIGDWANKSDTNHNKIISTLQQFDIVDDENLPKMDVYVESPEQYLLHFNCPIDYSDLLGQIRVQKYDNGKWQTLQNADLHLVQMDEEGREFIAELTTDWTVILNTKSTGKNYYSFPLRLYIPDFVLENQANGRKNLAIVAPLDSAIMKGPDTESPKILQVLQKDSTCVIEMDKPVQIGIGSEIVTPAQGQENQIPSVTVSFISQDNRSTVTGIVYAMVDGHDMAFKVRPTKRLSAGIWQVVVSGISDDVGNTASTLYTNNFKVTETGISCDPEFNMIWGLAIPAGIANPLTGLVENTQEDMLYIKFSGSYQSMTGVESACYGSNYSIGTKILSSNTIIDTYLKGYNQEANTQNLYRDLVAVHLPKGTFAGERFDVSVSNNIQSQSGEGIHNGGTKVFELNDTQTYYTWKYKTYTGTASAMNSYAALQGVLDDTDYVGYNFDHFTNYNFVDTQNIMITHSGVYNFRDNQFTNLEIQTMESGNILIEGGFYENIIVNAPNANVYLKDVCVTSTASSDGGKITLENALADGFTCKDVTANELVLIESFGKSSVKTIDNTRITTVTVNTATALDIDWNSAYTTKVVVRQPGNITFSAATSKVSVYVEETAVGGYFINESGSVEPELILTAMMTTDSYHTNVTPVSNR